MKKGIIGIVLLGLLFIAGWGQDMAQEEPSGSLKKYTVMTFTAYGEDTAQNLVSLGKPSE